MNPRRMSDGLCCVPMEYEVESASVFQLVRIQSHSQSAHNLTAQLLLVLLHI